MKKVLTFLFSVALSGGLHAQENFEGKKFEQMQTLLPTPNVYRTAGGSPGQDYWQQKVDYEIKVTLDDARQHISGWEKITYNNHSPHALNYLWLQLEQNVRSKNSDTYLSHTSKMAGLNQSDLTALTGGDETLGFNIEAVKHNGESLPFTINKTMMRVDLPSPLKPGEKFSFEVSWNYFINNRSTVGGRSGFEYFEEDGNYLYTIAQFYPRLAVYDDVNGWQNKQFLGRGEFALSFGDFYVEMTVPADHVVAATGALQNPEEVLTEKQISLLEKAKESAEPLVIISQEEAVQNEKSDSQEQKTWKFKAENVRDFAWASSRKFIWDAMGVDLNGRTVMAMSYYPKEANPLYGEYSTKVVAHTLKFYSRCTFDYPYPKAISVEANNGMEYPMIAFNHGRPKEDGTYSDRVKYGMISVIIHEVGHNFFPMIVNSDERQWTWMDEGINSFLQYRAEKEWNPEYPSRRGPVEKVIPYMKGAKENMEPIMTNSEQIKQFGNNAYGKPAAALNILRNVVMGPELFDFAFTQYTHKWMFKHPTPADFFRTMEEASAIDLDWFWKGWFYTTDHVDIALADVTWYKVDPGKKSRSARNKKENKEGLNADQLEKLENPTAITFLEEYKNNELSAAGSNFYELKLVNKGGLVMPVLVEINYKDGSAETQKWPAEIWRMNEKEVTKVIATQKEIAFITIDPERLTADVDTHNNYFPQRELSKKNLDIYKRGD